MNLSDFDAFAELRTTIWAIFAALSSVLRMSLGTFLYLAIIHFEKFGQDPKKRTLLNRILIYFCYASLFESWFGQIIFDWSLIIGPTSDFFAKMFIIQKGSFYFIAFLSIFEYVLVQNLMLFKFPMMAAINDDFWAIFLTLWNSGISFTIHLALAYINSYPKNVFASLTGTLPKGKNLHTFYSKKYNIFYILCFQMMTINMMKFGI